MKKIALIATLLLGILTSTAQQIAVTTRGDVVLPDGYTFTTNSLNSPTGTQPTPTKLRFKVTNLTQEDMIVGIKVISMSNNVDGSNLQLCYGVCLLNIQPGNIITDGSVLAAGATSTSDDDHFINMNPGTDGQPVNYQLAFVKLTSNEDGDLTVQETLQTINYTYSATAGTETAVLKQMGVDIKNTVVKNTVTIQTVNPANVTFYNINGAIVKSLPLNAGINNVDTTSFANGVYTATFTSGSKTASARIIKN